MTFFSPNRAARLLGIPENSLRYHRLKGNVPQLSHTENGRPRYTKTQVECMRRFLASRRKPNNGLSHAVGGNPMFSKREVTRILGTGITALDLAIKHGEIFPPTRGDGLRRYYSQADLEGIRKHFSKPLPLRQGKKPSHWSTAALAQGLYSISQAAVYLGMPLVTLTSYHKRNKLPKPNQPVGCYRCYSQADLDGFRKKELKSYFAKKK